MVHGSYCVVLAQDLLVGVVITTDAAFIGNILIANAIYLYVLSAFISISLLCIQIVIGCNGTSNPFTVTVSDPLVTCVTQLTIVNMLLIIL